jgi:hypothetical protein
VTERFLPSGRRIVVPENDLEERLVVAMMAGFIGDKEEGRRLTAGAIHAGDGTFQTFNPDRFYHLEYRSDGGFEVMWSDD